MSYRGRTISVVMPAYNEAQSVRAVVEGFQALPEVDEVIVVDNNSQDDTVSLAAAAGARVIREPRQGYGYASQRALLEAQGDWVLITESDGTFRPGDAYKFMQYGAEFDAVFGTRTSKTCIWRGANMGAFLRYGNVFVAKLLEYLHNGPCLTDVGCTYKLIWREALHAVSDYFQEGGSAFSPELMMTLIRSGLRCVEIPVHYRLRKGESKITGDTWPAFRLGMRMIGIIITRRFRSYPQIGTFVSCRVLDDLAELESANSESMTHLICGEEATQAE